MSSYAITGAARGIGYEYVNQLSGNSSNTVFALVRDTNAATKLETLKKSRSNVHIVAGDVSKPAELIAAAESISKVTGGKLDVLIHNAAATDQTTFGNPPSAFSPAEPEKTREAFQLALDTGVFGNLWLTNAMLPLIEAGQEKKIIHLSTGLADVDIGRSTGIAFSVAYSVAKAGTNIVVSKYAEELRPKGIKVLSMSPGWVDTEKLPEEGTPQRASYDYLLSCFQKADPSVKGMIKTEDSVRMQLEVIDRLDMNMSGKFVSHHGDRNWF